MLSYHCLIALMYGFVVQLVPKGQNLDLANHRKNVGYVSKCVVDRFRCEQCDVIVYLPLFVWMLLSFCCYLHSYSERGVVDIMMCTGAHFWPRFPLNWLIVAQSGPARVLRNPISNWEEQILPESQIQLQCQRIQIQILTECSRRTADKGSLNSRFKIRRH